MRHNIIQHIEDLGYEYKLSGLLNIQIDDISLIFYARENDLCYLDTDVPHLIKGKKNITLLCPLDFTENNPEISYIKVKYPKLVFYYVSHLFGNNKVFEIDTNVSEKYPGAIIGKDCKIGNDVNIQAGVIIRNNTIIGDGTTIETGTVIGSTGLLWVWDNKRNKKVMLTITGGTEIGKNCYICSNVSIVRGSCNEMTVIEDGVMIAPGTAVGHGCTIGKNTHIANNCTIGGTVIIGEECFLGCASTISPNAIVGNNVVVASGACIIPNDSIESDVVVVGIPAVIKKRNLKNNNLKGMPSRNVN
jgi:UDP-3-O-[3-hydroxymyristoyl] glucosamine N-acyltransferase